MKIGLINSLYKPYKRGGAEVVFSRIVKELKKNSHDVFVITISGKKNKTDFFITEMDDVRVYRFYPQNIFSFIEINQQPFWKRLIWHFIDFFNWHSYGQVKKIFKKEKPDLVLTHNVKGLGYLTWQAIRKLKIKNIHTLHDVQLVNPSGLIIKGREKQGFLGKIFSKISKKMIKNPEVVISPSKWLLDFYRGYGFFKKSKEIVLPNPLVLDEQEISKKFEDDKITYLFLGQLEEHKGILFLLDLFPKFNKLGNCRLVVVGSGRLEKELKERYKNEEWLEFLGYVPANKLSRQVFKKIHYTIVPSLCYENSPSVIYDSFKCATPVIASEIGGVPELVQEGVNGYTFEAGNKISLLNKLNLSLQNIDNYQQMSENARIRAKDFDIKNYIYKILQL
ncbi:MAG TPA: glycosyltransferase [Candidatus Uhrbacteria bacterium]|nr:glycosyltransferase [Candidatus Uhrbacteria bacterium]